PSLTEADLECFRKQAAGGPECVPERAAEQDAAEPDAFVVQGAPPVPTPRPDAGATGDPAPATSPVIVDDDAEADLAADTNPNAVLLPELIVDLFPTPPPGPVGPAGPDEPATATDTARPTTPPPVNPPPVDPPPPGSLAGAPPVTAPVAVQGQFVPDEVL